MDIDWVQLAKDWGLVLGFAAVFLILIRGMLKNSPPPDHLVNAPSQSPAPRPAAPASRAGNYAEITAAISAAVNEYQKINK
jgi:hypothetical protein